MLSYKTQRVYREKLKQVIWEKSFFFFFTAPFCRQYLSSPTRDRTQAVKVRSPNYQTTREFPRRRLRRVFIPILQVRKLKLIEVTPCPRTHMLSHRGRQGTLL